MAEGIGQRNYRGRFMSNPLNMKKCFSIYGKGYTL